MSHSKYLRRSRSTYAGTGSTTLAAPASIQPARRRMCHLYSAGLTPHCLFELQFWDRLCIDTRIVHHPIMPGFRSQVCRLVKFLFPM